MTHSPPHLHKQQQHHLRQERRLRGGATCSAEMLLLPMIHLHPHPHPHLQQKCLQQYQCHRLQLRLHQLRLHQLPVCSAEMLLPPMTPSHQLLHQQRWDPWALRLIVPNLPWQGPRQQHRKRQHKLPLQGMDL
jgi:hypothetical protein